MAMIETLSAFFNTSEFATSATIAGVAVTGIFDNGYAQGSVGIAGMASTQPSITLPTANVPANPVGQATVVNGVHYIVAAHEPDGTGISRLVLELA